MAMVNTTTRYGSVNKFLHWLVFLLVLTLLIVGFYMGDITDKDLKGLVYNLHKLLGLLVLVLMIFRLIWVLANPKPDLPFPLKPWERVAERSVRGLMYLTLIAMPLSGWIMSTAAGKAPHFFGYFAIPMPGIAVNREVVEATGTAHYYISLTIMALVSIHVLAALKHHFINKDKVLKRMLPGGE